MNKKNITIDTNFFDDGIEAKLKSYHTDSLQGIDTKKQGSSVEQNRRTSFGNGIPNSRYEHVPDNQYSTAYEVYEMPAESIQKLQATNSFQNIISRAMANLFVRCWEEMKGKLPQYSHLVEKKKSNRINNQVLEDYNNVFNNNSEQGVQDFPSQNGNAYSQNKHTLNERKNQIIGRQKIGFTLDSLSKEKLNRSKQTKKEPVKIKKRQNSEIQGSAVSRKSYRQKFLNYKHRSISKDFGIQKSIGYPKVSSGAPLEKTTNLPSFNRGGYYSSKIQILRNINDMLMDRQEIYPGQNCNYYMNHRDSSRNMFISSAHPYNSKIYYNNFPTQYDTYQGEQDELLRTRLIEQIVNKLQYSKLRLQEISKSKSDDQVILLRIDKLQKIILELKKQERTYQNKQQQPQIIHHQIEEKNRNQSQNLEIYKKIIDQIYSLRLDIRQIRTLRNTEPKEIIQITNPQTDFIFEQQKLLNSYQQEFKRIVNEREKTNVLTYKQPEQKIETAYKSIFDQLIQNGKNNQRRVTWNDRWQTNQKLDNNQRIKPLNNEDFYEKYRYTRNQILQDIGSRTHIQEQERIIREEQARQQFARQNREKETKLMIENVRRHRKQENEKKITINQPKPTRDIYEKQWQKYQKTKIDSEEKQNPLCAFFPC